MWEVKQHDIKKSLKKQVPVSPTGTYFSTLRSCSCISTSVHISQSWLSVKKAEVFPVCWYKLKLEIWFNWGKNNDKNNVFHFSSSGNTWRVCGTCCLFGLQLPRRWGSFDFFCCHSGKNFWANLCVTFRGNHGHFSQCCKWTNASENL